MVECSGYIATRDAIYHVSYHFKTVSQYQYKVILHVV